MANSRRVYRPARTFDDDLVDLAVFYGRNELVFGAINGVTLGEAGEAQRSERKEHGRLQGEAKAYYEAFIRSTRKRHRLYMRALDHARACFRDDAAKTAELRRYSRHFTRNGNGVSDEVDPAVASTATPWKG
jgi:hypothetical protein